MKVWIVLIILTLLCINSFAENITPIAPPSPYEQNQKTIMELLGQISSGLTTINQNLTASATPEDLNTTTKILSDQINETKEIANSKVDAGTVVVIVLFASGLNWCFFFLMKGWGKA